MIIDSVPMHPKGTRTYKICIERYPEYPQQIDICGYSKSGKPVYAQRVSISTKDKGAVVKLALGLLRAVYGELSAQSILIDAVGELSKEK